jgi:hypothetical protein
MWKRKIITVGGTMQRVVPSDSKAESPQAISVIIQMLPASGGDVGYVEFGVKLNETPDHTVAFQFAKAASSTVAGLPFVYQVQDIHSGERIDMSELCVDGAHNGDTILVAWYEIPK